MVGVSVRAIGRKCDDNLRLYMPNVCGEFSNDLSWLCLIHVAINIIKKVDCMQTEMLSCTIQFFRADQPDSFEAGVWPFTIVPAHLSARYAHQMRFNAFGRITCQRGA